jgi:hypothetical protein
LGNLKTEGAEKVLNAYVNNSSVAQFTMATTPINEMVKKHGNADSLRLFGAWDYANLLLLKYLRSK